MGKFKKIKSFTGAIANLYVFFYPLSEYEIKEHYQDGLNDLQNGDGIILQKVLEKDESDFNRQTFATSKNLPDEVLKQVDVNPSFFKSIAEEPTDSEMNERVENETDLPDEAEINHDVAISNLNEFIFEHPLSTDQLTQIANNYEWILTVSSVISTGDINKDGALSLSRFMKILKFCNIKISRNLIWEICQITNTTAEILDEEDDKIKHKAVLYYYFLKTLREAIFSDVFSNVGDNEFDKVSVGHYSDSDDHIEYEEEEPEEEEKDEQSEMALAAGRRKDSFHSSPGKIPKIKKQIDPDEQDEGEEQTLAPVLDVEVPVADPPVSINQDKSVNDEGLMKLDQQDEVLDKAYEEKMRALEEPEEQEVPDQQEEVIETSSLPELEDGWNIGSFKVNIIRFSG